MVMNWLPFEDAAAGMSEELILKYNPKWTGGGETRHEIFVPEFWMEYFETELSEVFDIDVPFTRESWNGRIKSCRGIGAALSEFWLSDGWPVLGVAGMFVMIGAGVYELVMADGENKTMKHLLSEKE